ncbi:unnamed protein product [Merluccius merluccius]
MDILCLVLKHLMILQTIMSFFSDQKNFSIIRETRPGPRDLDVSSNHVPHGVKTHVTVLRSTWSHPPPHPSLVGPGGLAGKGEVYSQAAGGTGSPDKTRMAMSKHNSASPERSAVSLCAVFSQTGKRHCAP